MNIDAKWMGEVVSLATKFIVPLQKIIKDFNLEVLYVPEDASTIVPGCSFLVFLIILTVSAYRYWEKVNLRFCISLTTRKLQTE